MTRRMASKRQRKGNNDGGNKHQNEMKMTILFNESIYRDDYRFDYYPLRQLLLLLPKRILNQCTRSCSRGGVSPVLYR